MIKMPIVMFLTLGTRIGTTRVVKFCNHLSISIETMTNQLGCAGNIKIMEPITVTAEEYY